MNNKLKKFIQRLQSIRMTDAEKALGRSRLLEFISFNPLRGDVPMPRERKYISIFTVGHFVKATALILIVGIVATGSGVSYAASNALPGEKLYTVKVNVNEKIEDRLAFSDESKVAVQSKKVERRLEEAQALAKDNKLSSTHTEILRTKLEEHIGELEKEIQDLKDEGELDVVLETTSKIAPVLEVHKEILIGQSKDGSGSDNGESTTLIAAVETSIEKMAAEEHDALLIASNAVVEEPVSASMMMSFDASDTETAILSKESSENERTTTVSEPQNTLSIVNARIDSAKDKLDAIEKAYESKDVFQEPQPAPEATEKEELMEKIASPKNEDASKKESTEIISATETLEQSVVLPELVDPTVTTTDSPAAFDMAAQIKEAALLIETTEDLVNKNRYDEALSTIQRAHHIISGIETYQKIKFLKLAEASTTSAAIDDQKASAVEAVKEPVETSLIK